MATRLRRGGKLRRIVPSRTHDCRKTREMVVELDHELQSPEIHLRPLGCRCGVSITLDGLYEMLVRASIQS